MIADPAFRTDPARACAPRPGDEPMPHWTSDDAGMQDVARALCRRCPVRDDCLAWALGQGEMYGVWGGALMSSATERNQAAARLGSTSEQVRQLHGQGRLDAEIARSLGITKSTVRKHRLRLGLPAVAGPGRPKGRVAA